MTPQSLRLSRSLLEEAQLGALQHRLRRLQALLLLQALLTDPLVMLHEEVAGLVEVVDLRLQNIQLVALRALGLLGILEMSGPFRLLALLRDDENPEAWL